MPADDWLRRFTDMVDLGDGGDDGNAEGKPALPATGRPQPLGADAVRVVVDETGVMQEVLVAPDWRRSIQPRALGEALLTSANDGIVGAIDFAVAPPVAHTRPDVQDAGGDPAGPVAQRLVSEILDLFGRFDADLADYREQLRATAVPHRAAGMNRRVTVTMSGGLVQSVEVDVRWAERCRYTEISAEASSAFRSAQQADAGARAAVREPGSLARLRELSGDPHALCRQLGLTAGGTRS